MGWDRTGNSIAGGVGIHHPRGDVKKIATYSIAPPINSYCASSNLYWDVNFDETLNGKYSVMQQGSSGSPLTASNHKVIGQLYGPYNSERCPPYQCDAPERQKVAYGKFSISWTGNNNSDKRRRLKDWLDPNNTGESVLDGTDGTNNLLPPTNLTATNIRYNDFKLSWTGTEGATGYEVYNLKNNLDTLIGTTSETALSITNLAMGSTYKYAVKAKYQNVVSDYSDTLSVTTVQPEITGADVICNQEIYTIENFLPNTTVQWSASNGKLEKVAVQENGKKAIFKKKGIGACTVRAKIAGNPNPLEKAVRTTGVPAVSDIQIHSNTEIFNVFPDDFFMFIYDNAECYLDVPATLYTSAPNVVNARSLFDISGNTQGIPTVGYEWQIISGEEDWTIDPAYFNYVVEDNENLNLAPYSFLLVTYNSSQVNPSTLPPPPPIFKVRLHTPCGISEWKVVSGFDVKDCGNSGFYSLLTPNGDGANDTFEITGGKIRTTYKSDTRTVIPIYNLKIFNRQGETVYQKENYMQGEERFTGIGNAGKYADRELPEGTYFLTITGAGNSSGYIFLKRE